MRANRNENVFTLREQGARNYNKIITFTGPEFFTASVLITQR